MSNIVGALVVVLDALLLASFRYSFFEVIVVEDGLLPSFAPETSRSIVRNGLASLMATASCKISRLIMSLSVERLTFMVSMYS